MINVTAWNYCVSEMESKLRGSDHPHSLEVSKMANDIMAKCEAIEKKPKRALMKLKLRGSDLLKV